MKPTSSGIEKYIEILNANPLYLFHGTLPIYLDEQLQINKISEIKKKEIELEELKRNLWFAFVHIVITYWSNKIFSICYNVMRMKTPFLYNFLHNPNNYNPIDNLIIQTKNIILLNIT